ncbi:hypothetical protein [uncultured Leifsonia sp.]|uniref:DUF7927 domain-containing protein n=1 Tax=uncultured Leifsonia sp. TaxID=340359 RepID=UPI0028D62F5A|nr:hypothetical protein [uncultured Leifsonia sp.]
MYEITAKWADGTPTTVASGDVLTAEWRVNVNDDAAAPSNAPVDNVNFTLTIDNGEFTELPASCLTTGVTPVSSISADGRTMVCNIGTKDQGTSHVIQTPIRADGETGSQITGTGTIDGATADLSPIAINNPFGMDIRWSVATNSYSLKGYPASPTVDLDLQWTLSKDKRSADGPQTVTYDLTTSGPFSSISVGAQQCTPFTSGVANGHPWSGGSHPADQMVTPVTTCTVQQTGANTFRLTLTGIDYNPATPATKDSTGAGLPADQVALASGSIWLHLVPTSAGSITLQSSAPTYTSAAGTDTAKDDPANNTVTKTWFYPGTFTSPWNRGYTGSGGSNYDSTYVVSPGTTIQQSLVTGLPGMDRADTLGIGMCAPVDTKYLDFVDIVPGNVTPGAVISYYVGNDPTVNPASASYNPQAFPNCGATTGWTTTPPADPSTVKAVRVTFTQGQAESWNLINAGWLVRYTVKDTAPVGQDIWNFMYSTGDGTNWASNGACATNTPGLRYPCTAVATRDLVRIVGTTPYIEKTADRGSVNPGQAAGFSLTYSANVPSNLPTSVDGYQIVDTLPAGMTYVDGSATPAPTVTTNGSGQQVLTWVLDGVTTNIEHALTYQAVAAATVKPGTVLENSAVASVSGTSSQPATAQVVVAANGYTEIGKAADTPYIPNVNGDGKGDGSWTVTLRSFDPTAQTFTDTIDILPYNGDGRGTSFGGSYALTSIDAVAGATVYYTTADPATLSDDPADPSNGAAGDPAGNSVGWSTTFVPNATAVRVVGPQLAAGATQQFKVNITTDGVKGGDKLVNRAQARSEHTELVMRTSAPILIANYYSAALKKEVQDADGNWHDANDVTDYPTFRVGDTIHYRVTVTNTGQGTLTNVKVSDDKQPQLGSFTIDTLAPGDTQSHEYSITATGGEGINTACAAADVPADSGITPTINCDPAGVDVVDYSVVKTSDPATGSTVKPGDVIHYTITVTQKGTVPAAAELHDALAGVTDDATYNGDLAADLGTATLNDGTIDWTGTVPVGGVAKITYSVTVKDSASLGNSLLDNVVTSPGCAEQADCETHHEVGTYEYSKTSDPAPGTAVKVGQTVTYTVTVRQVGAVAQKGVTVTDDLSDVLDDATWVGDEKADSGSVSRSGNTLTWKGDLAVGKTVTITYSVKVLHGDGNLTLNNQVESPGGTCVPAADQNPDCRTTHPIGGFNYSKMANPKSPASVKIGDTITYTVTATQFGPAAYPGASLVDDLSGVLDDATYNDDAKATAGTVVRDGDTLKWTGDLAVGQTVTITYSVTVVGNGDTTIRNAVTAPDGGGECVPAPDGTPDCTTIHKYGGYTFSKTSNPKPGTEVKVGDRIDYTVTVNQTGEGPTSGTVVDDLSKVLDDATWVGNEKASSGVVVRDGDTLTWKGDLAVGQVVTITYSVTVTGDGDKQIRNVVTSPDKDAACVPAADQNPDCTTNHHVDPPAPTGLASTGSDLVAPGIIALLLVGAGATFLVIRRRRTAE